MKGWKLIDDHFAQNAWINTQILSCLPEIKLKSAPVRHLMGRAFHNQNLTAKELVLFLFENQTTGMLGTEAWSFNALWVQINESAPVHFTLLLIFPILRLFSSMYVSLCYCFKSHNEDSWYFMYFLKKPSYFIHILECTLRIYNVLLISLKIIHLCIFFIF